MQDDFFPYDYWGHEQETQVEFITGAGKPDCHISSVGCIAIVPGGKIVLANVPRGFDFPGGHMEKDETPLEALHRELEEEVGGYFIHEPTLIGSFIANKQRETKRLAKYPKQSRVDFFIGRVRLSEDFAPQLESTERIILSIDSVRKYHHRWNQQIEAVLEYAKTRYHHLFEC